MLRTAVLVALAASTTAIDAAAQPASVTFSRRSAAAGDQAEQTIAVDFRVKMTTRRGATVLDESETHLHRDHQRVITTTRIGDGGARTGTVAYRVAQQSVGGDVQRDPVVGKTYVCQRDGETLRITTPDGALPPLAEFEIVARNMETFGRANPLAAFFEGRTVSVGERVELPVALAAKLLGFERKFASAKRFALTLTRVELVEGRRCAVFHAEIEAGSGDRGQMGLVVEGPMVMQVAGCRTVSAKLSGPLGMSETQTVPGGPVQVTGVGKLSLAMTNRYRNQK